MLGTSSLEALALVGHPELRLARHVEAEHGGDQGGAVVVQVGVGVGQVDPEGRLDGVEPRRRALEAVVVGRQALDALDRVLGRGGVVAAEILAQHEEALVARLAVLRVDAPGVVGEAESTTLPTVVIPSWANQEPPMSILGVTAAVARAPKLFLLFTSLRLSPWPL